MLVVLGHKFKPVGFTLTMPNGTFSHSISDSEWKPAEDGAEVMIFDLSRMNSPAGKVNVKVEIAATVQFGNADLPCDEMVVEAVLEHSGRMVEYIVNCFGKKFFGE